MSRLHQLILKSQRLLGSFCSFLVASSCCDDHRERPRIYPKFALRGHRGKSALNEGSYNPTKEICLPISHILLCAVLVNCTLLLVHHASWGRGSMHMLNPFCV